MDEFLINITQFPTAIYTTLLIVVLGYWLIALLGNFDFDAFDVGVDIDLELEGDGSEAGKMTGLLSTLGLTGVPITIVLTFLVLNAWFISYFVSFFIPEFPSLISLLKTLIDVGIAIGSFMFSIIITNIMIRPLKNIFKKLNQEPISKSLLGTSCRIRSSRADSSFGEAECLHEGASLIIKVRATGNNKFSTGDKVVAIEHNKDNDTFTIVSEKEFNQQIN